MVKDYVPYLKSWHENIATRARVTNSNPPAEETPAERPGHIPHEPKPRRCAKTMINSKDFSRKSCLELLKSTAFAANRNNQSGLSADGGSPDSGGGNVALGAFVHGGMKGITKRTLQHYDITKYLIAFMVHHGSQEEFTWISIVQGGNLRVKSDPRNHRTGSCCMITLGDFKGGELWIEDSGPKANHKVVGHNDTTLTGRLVPLSDQATIFDSSHLYKTMPWVGERWAIMACNSSAYDQLDDSQVEKFRRSGFVLHERKKEFPSCPGVPTRDMTLFELATMDYPAPRPAELRTKPKVKFKAAPKASLKLSPRLARQAGTQGERRSWTPVALLRERLMSQMVLRLNPCLMHLQLHLLAEVILLMIRKELKH